MASKRSYSATSLQAQSEAKVLEELSFALTAQGKEFLFSCGGSIPVAKETTGPLIVCWWNGNGQTGTETVHKAMFPSADGDVSIEKLVGDCQPAGFGRGNEAVYDETYRKAGKIDVEQFVTNFDPHKLGIIDKILHLLRPDGSGIVAELYKLNVYSTGGKFRPHVDTPRSEKQFGSLVVSLPCKHEGGDLAIRHEGKEVLHSWGDSSGSALQWAAFYSDCEHEVLPVTSGHRFTLTYNLYDADRTSVHTAVPGSIQYLPLYAEIAAALAQPGFMREGGVLGIYCAHSYAHVNMQGIAALPQGLKGIDAAIFQICNELGLEVALRPCIMPMGGYHMAYPNPGGEREHDNSSNADNSSEDENPVVIGESLRPTTFDDEWCFYDEDQEYNFKRLRDIFPGQQAGNMKWLNEWKHKEVQCAYPEVSYLQSLKDNYHGY